MDKEKLLVLCACPDKEIAEMLARQLVEAGLAACVNRISGVSSTYMWQGELQQDQEELLLIKTSPAVWNELEQEIVRLHPYELPEIIAVPITRGSEKYLQWISQNTH